MALTGRPLPVVAAVTLWLSAAPISVSVLLLLAAIRPRLTDNPATGSWLDAAHRGPASLLATYRADTETGLAAAHDLCGLAVIARAKYRRIQTAVTALVIGLGVLTVALVLSVITAEP
ncbi:Pycsar system effector family protein [Actinokineospora alba]|uniref:Pycsar system effector family protein n=1 Tax=Actinokineospora alba TaxID=504798 RepID=UPI003898E98E